MDKLTPLKLPGMIRNSRTSKTILFAAMLGFTCASIAWAEGNPDPNVLFDQYKNRQDQKPSFFTNKADFVAGADEVIDAMKNKKEVRTSFAGLPAKPPPYIDEQFGIQMNATGCVINPPLETKNMGRRAALLWYADRGEYPVNSTKPHKPLDKVPRTTWSPLTDNKELRTEIRGSKDASLVLTHENACSYLKLEPSKLPGNFLVWPWSVPPTDILWSYDKAKNVIWFDVPAPYVAKTKNNESKFPRHFIELDPSTGYVLQTRDANGNLL